jgi:hypothetical protein
LFGAAVDAPQDLLVVADPLGHGFKRTAQLGDLVGESGERVGLAGAKAVLVDDGSQLSAPVEGCPAEPRPGSDRVEGDRRLLLNGPVSAQSLTLGQIGATTRRCREPPAWRRGARPADAALRGGKPT